MDDLQEQMRQYAIIIAHSCAEGTFEIDGTSKRKIEKANPTSLHNANLPLAREEGLKA